MDISRRRVLKYGGGAILGLGLLPQTARASVQAALAVAGTVAGMLASRHRRDVSAIYASFNSQKLDLVVSQLSSLHQTLEEQFKHLSEHLHGGLLDYSTAKLLEGPKYIEEMGRIRISLSSGLNLLRSSEVPNDASAALTVPSATFALNAVNLIVFPNQTNYRKQILVNSYNHLIDIIDPERQGSAAQQLAIAVKELETADQNFFKSPVVKPLTRRETKQAHCIGIDEIIPRRRKYKERCGGGRMGMDCRKERDGWYPEQRGSSHRWATDVTLYDEPVRRNLGEMLEISAQSDLANERVRLPKVVKIESENREYSFDNFEPSLSLQGPDNQLCRETGAIITDSTLERAMTDRNRSRAAQHASTRKFNADYAAAQDAANDLNLKRHLAFFHYNCVANATASLDRIEQLLELA